MSQLVSVIITTYGAPIKLKRAIDSVLRQSYSNIEVLVVDDNNPETVYREETEQIMNYYNHYMNVKYFKHIKNMNGAAARNTGIHNASGEYIAFLDNDDVWLPSRVQKSVAKLEEYTDFDAVYCDVLIVKGQYAVDLIRTTSAQDLTKNLLLNDNVIGTGSNLFFSKSSVGQVGLFDEDFNRFQDVEYLLRYFQKGFKIRNINEILVIKDDDIKNNATYKKVKSGSDLLMNKFETIILSLSLNEKKEFYNRIYTNLLTLSLYENDRKAIQQQVSTLKSIRNLTNDEQKRIKYHWIIVLKNKIKRVRVFGYFFLKLSKVKQNKLKQTQMAEVEIKNTELNSLLTYL